MPPERWAEVDSILAEALELPKHQRADFLDRKCVTFPELRTEIESLLTIEERASAFLDAQTWSTDSLFSEIAAEKPELAGPYRLYEEVGRGGMGAVYRAEREDGQFRKRVAVKFLEAGTAASSAWKRFEDERQIMASLDHPNICRLMDAGITANGRPYLVMEFVDGKPLCDATSALAESEKLRMFQKVCAAVQYAHQNLVVHRDIKPGNVMVTAGGDLKLMDFGIAKILEPSLGDQQTQLLFRALTPDYASPEQIRGVAVTTQSDIYSLGVLLYEILTGERPYRLAGQPIEKVLETIRASRLSLSAAGLSPDLLAIVRKAMRFDPAERYASASELSTDIERYLQRLPVHAREWSRWYVARTFIARRKWSLAASAAIAGVILVLATVAWRQAQLAHNRFADVQGLAHAVLYELDDAIAQLPGSTPTRKLLAQRSLQYLDRLNRDSSRDTGLLLSIAGGYVRLGRVLGGFGESNLGDSRAALAAMTKARAIVDDLKARLGPAPDVMEVELSLNVRMARLLPAEKSLPLIRQAIANGESLVRVRPDASHRNDLAAAYLTYSDRLPVGDEKKISYLRKAVELYDVVLQSAPGDREFQRNVALAHKRLGSALCLLGQTADCLAQLDLALRLDESRHRGNPLDQDGAMDLAISLSELALHLFKSGQRERVIELSERSVALRRTVWQQDPTNVRFAGRLVYALTTLAYYHSELKHWKPAASAAAEAVDVVKRSNGRLDSPAEVLRAYRTLAQVESNAGRDGCPHLVAARKFYHGIAPSDRHRFDIPALNVQIESGLKSCR